MNSWLTGSLRAALIHFRSASIGIAEAVIVLALTAAVVSAAPVAAGGPTSPKAAGAATGELESLRTAVSKTVRNADGTLTTSIYQQPINYRASDGTWKPISAALVPSTTSGYLWQSEANRFTTLLKPLFGSGYLAVKLDGSIYGFSVDGANPSVGIATGNTVTYPDVVSGVTVTDTSVPEGVKETIKLANHDAPATYRFWLDGPTGQRIVAEPRPGGSLAIVVGNNDAPAFYISAPTVSDGNGKSPGAKPTLKASLVGGRLAIDLSIDGTWLKDPARVFPVVIDPTISISQPSQDGNFDANCSSCGQSNDDSDAVGSGSSSIWRDAVQFNLADIPSGASISDAELRFYWGGSCINVPNVPYCSLDHTIDVHRLNAPWNSNTASSGFTYDGATLSSVTINHNDNTGWRAWNVTSTVQDWQTGAAPNYGLLLKRQTDATGSGGITFSSALESEPTLRPHLDVTFSGDGVQLDPPTTLHANGADLSWSRYTGPSGTPFQKYEIHRSTSAQFTPNASTLLATITDPSITTYRDTTAAPSRTFTYKIVANSSASNPETVTLPADGQAEKILQPTPATAQDTYIAYHSDFVDCGNEGNRDVMHIAAENPSGGPSVRRRSLIRFDLRDIPSNATITSAQMSLWRPWWPYFSDSVEAHRVTAAWQQGTGQDECNGSGATWYDTTGGGTQWATNGGDFDSAVAASVSLDGNSAPGWDNYDLTTLARQWISGQAANLGVALKLANENATDEGVDYYSSDYTGGPTLAPKLVVTYTDGSHAQGPTVSVTGPRATDTLSGSTALTATATDDHLVDHVDFYVDGGLVGTAQSAPYSVTWNSAAVTSGAHQFTAIATDDAGNTTTSAAVNAQVDNSAPPTTSITGFSPDYSNQVNADTPVAYWRLGDPVGSTAFRDSTASGLDAALTGAPTLGDTGAIGGDSAATFSGNYQFGEAPYTAALNPNHFTVEAWVKVTGGQNTWRPPVNSRNDNCNGSTCSPTGYNLYASDSNTWEFWLGSGASDWSIVDGPALAVNQWTQLVATWDGSTAALYVNGALAGILVPPAFVPNTVNPFDIGKYFPGSIDEVSVYNHALTSTRVQAHYNAAALVRGTTTITANAVDDRAVAKVEFYDGSRLIGTDTTLPYSASWNTLDPASPAYDGTHALTTKAYDTSGNVTTSNAVTLTVGNGLDTQYQASYSSAGLPAAMTYDPSVQTQDSYPVDVTVTNQSASTWSASTTSLRYRWVSSDASPTFTDGPSVALSSNLAAGASQTVHLTVQPPSLPSGVDRAGYTLRFDLYDSAGGGWYALHGSRPFEQQVTINRAQVLLGLERYYYYDQTPLGAGMTNLVNVANGDSIVQWSPFAEPGRGLSTVLQFTYNSLEQAAASPAGNNWSVSLSTLTRLGSPLDVHPNSSDTAAGRSAKYIDVTDGDGTTLRFTSSDGTYWVAPPGVHLYLRQYSTTDATKKWALTRPDRVTFYYDSAGYPTGVEDKNGNRLDITEEQISVADQTGTATERVTAVTDAAGQGGSPAANRKFTITYYSAATAKTRGRTGKIATITDHSGKTLSLDYYDDGNLMRITEAGGTNADGSALASRSVVFTYTNTAATGPAIATAAARANPDPATIESTKLYSVIDPRGNESTLSYIAPSGATNDWKLASITDRAGATTTYTYTPGTRTTSVARPLSRNSTYVYDINGRVTSITNPLNQTTTVLWTADNAVQRVTEPNGHYVEYAYNANGYLTDSWDELRNHTQLDYTSIAVDNNDTASHWETGRTVAHISQLADKIDPNGTASPAAGDYQWTFAYDSAGNLKTVTDPIGAHTDATYNADGTLASITDANTHTTTFAIYDANGLPTRIVDPLNRVTTLGYSDDGLVLWIQDPNHASAAGGDPRSYRSYFNYDAFGRLGRQSTPKSTANEPGNLIWSDASYDANDNIVATTAPHFGTTDTRGDVTRTSYDAMDRRTQVTSPNTTVDPAGARTQYVYDAAGRITQVTLPNGVLTPSIDKDYATFYSYDALDRVIKQTRYLTDANGAVTQTRNTLSCYDNSNDLRWIVAPLAGLSSISPSDCSGTVPSNTTQYSYDASHRLTSTTDALGHTNSAAFDANGNTIRSTDANGNDTVATYDQRGQLTKVVAPFIDGATPRTLTTMYNYDPAGNLQRLISPRAYDASADKTTFTNYVTHYVYDAANELVRTDLPTDATTSAAYVHNGYDANGHLLWSSLPVATSDPNAVTQAQKTTLTLFDPGWIRTSTDPANPTVHFDYTATGQQAMRVPENGAGQLDLTRQMTWSYLSDGQLSEMKDQAGQSTSYAYDANGNPTAVTEASGLTSSSQAPMAVQMSYDTLGELAKVRERQLTAPNYTFTSYAYDLNGQLANEYQNGVETPAGSQVTAPRQQQYTYNAVGQPTVQIDGVGLSDAQKITMDYTPIGALQQRVVMHSTGGGAYAPDQTTARTYFDNGLLKTLNTTDAQGTTVQAHTLSYIDTNGNFDNGNKTSDQFTLLGPSTTAPCRTTACNTTYAYNARDQLTQTDDGLGTVTQDTVDLVGNVTTEAVTTGGTTTTTTNTYAGQQITSSVTAGSTQLYWYDPNGNVKCTTTGAGSAADCGPASGGSAAATLLTDYSYDYRNRLASARQFSGGTMTDQASYTFDALSRPVEEIEQHPANVNRDSLFTYLGLTNNVSGEQRKDGSGITLSTNSYSYDANGLKIGLTNTPSGQSSSRFTYGYDPHGNVALLLKQAGGAQASYGYQAYGSANSQLTAGDTSTTDPLNPYRYTGKRYDSGSKTIDMGARRFSPATGRFLQQDLYSSATANLSLGTDPLTGGRYSLAGGNPINYVEADGHHPVTDEGDGGHFAPTPGVGGVGGGGWTYVPPPPAPPAPPPPPAGGGDPSGSTSGSGTGSSASSVTDAMIAAGSGGGSPSAATMTLPSSTVCGGEFCATASGTVTVLSTNATVGGLSVAGLALTFMVNGKTRVIDSAVVDGATLGIVDETGPKDMRSIAYHVRGGRQVAQDVPGSVSVFSGGTRFTTSDSSVLIDVAERPGQNALPNYTVAVYAYLSLPGGESIAEALILSLDVTRNRSASKPSNGTLLPERPLPVGAGAALSLRSAYQIARSLYLGDDAVQPGCCDGGGPR